MDERLRFGEHSGIVVKNRSQLWCLIVRKKGDGSVGAGSTGARWIYGSKTDKKRYRMIMSDSGSSDELVMPPRRRVGPETFQVSNGLAVYEESEIGRKRNREERITPCEEGFIGWNDEDLSWSKRNRLDVFDVNEYDGFDEDMIMRRNGFDYGGDNVSGRQLLGSMPAITRMSIEREYCSGPSMHVFNEKKKKKNLYFDQSEGMSQGDDDDRNRFRKDRDGTPMHYQLLWERYMADSDKPIRVQGKNGVLKVMVNKRKKFGEPLKNFDHLEVEEGQVGSRIDDAIRRNLYVHPSLYSETEVLEKPVSFGRKEKKNKSFLMTPTTKKNKVSDSDSENSGTSPKLQPKHTKGSNPTKRVNSKEEKAQVEQLQPTRSKEGKVRRGCGTEKQKLRERIRGMLQEAGWTIDYRPRRNRDYLDAVYINPAGTAYWSIIKAYDALQKQLDEDNERKPFGDGPAFTPLSDEVLGQLTRKIGKKMKREMKHKQKDESGSENAQEPVARKSTSTRHEEESMDSLSHEEKSSFMKGKSSKSRMNDNDAFSGNAKGQSSLHMHDSYEKPPSMSNSHRVHGRKSTKLGRCTLLVRGSNVDASSESEYFVPYYGKRTLLAWLIDSGAVHLSQKVLYMKRRRTEVMLEGWITRDGIHCGCCSKILTVSKFEIHAGSKLRQPFQNIFLDTGVSLLQCQIDAWNRQVESVDIGFHSVDVNGDDPNDYVCGICGDGGDLICCDSCPSTFHQNCLNIEFLPEGEWQCPYCICKFCGNCSGIVQEDAITDCAVLVSQFLFSPNKNRCSFCLFLCIFLFEHLQKYLGVKHELEGGFSWSLIQRTDADSDIFAGGLSRRVECNSKLAVAMTVLNECFLPILDRRSGINLVHKLVIPAIPELTHTWTAVFGFTALEESVRQEMRSMNMLVFPCIPMLQKVLLKLENTQANLMTDAGAAPRSNGNITPRVASGSEPDSSSGIDTQEYDDGVFHHSSRINGETAAADSDSQCPNVSVNDTCGNSDSSDKSPKPNDETTLANYQAADSRNVLGLDSKYDANPSSRHDALEMQIKAGLDYPAEDNQSDDGTDSRSGDKATGSASDSENTTTSTDYNDGKTAISDSAINRSTRFREDGDPEAVKEDNNIGAASNFKTKLTVEDTAEHTSQPSK
ncbi:Imidazoleglycerol-phosphate dehydratase [Hibiscus syriacus]|uniref:Imidazoleglycerol-phosphate dehydratase n=1 Tax=Hibiscus syriacus TaxID=106335 RepID=A0A6A3AEA1_HIBSY|nr:Imidazoleglycerol-phosphate dehydratase [Hibiscus syriacus]